MHPGRVNIKIETQIQAPVSPQNQCIHQLVSLCPHGPNSCSSQESLPAGVINEPFSILLVESVKPLRFRCRAHKAVSTEVSILTAA